MAADSSVKEARLELIRAQTAHLQVETAANRITLGHQEANNKLRIYRFPSVILAETVDTCIEVIEHWLALSDDPITVAFNSPGGVIFEGWALYDYIADHVENGVSIDTTAYGQCASMAAVCLQAGRERSLRRNAYFMVHEVTAFLEGMHSMQSMKDQTEFSNQLQERIERVLVSRANPEKITQDILHQRTKHTDWWFTAEEALEYGFIDKIAMGI